MYGPDHRPFEKAFINTLFMALSIQQLLCLPEYTKDTLLKLDRQIRYFLTEFRRLVGPVRETDSKCGLRISKFHALLHFVWYIERFGSPINFFGGHAESLLKTILKANTKNTSRRQDVLDKDLMNRNHEDSVCAASRRYLEEIDWLLSYKERNTAFDDPTESRFHVHTPVFSATQTEDEAWIVTHGKDTYDKATYPSVRGFQEGDGWVQSVFDYADKQNCALEENHHRAKANHASLEIHGAGEENPAYLSSEHTINAVTDGLYKYDTIEFSFGCDIRSRHNTDKSHDTFRCHPNFHSFPHKRRTWHDWAMVRWAHDDGRVTQNAARIQLWATISNSRSVSSTTPPLIVAVVRSLMSDTPKPDPYIPFALGDKILPSDKTEVVPVTTIEEVAYVLPAIEKINDPFPETLEQCSYFVIIPPRSTWKDKVWENISLPFYDDDDTDPDDGYSSDDDNDTSANEDDTGCDISEDEWL